MNSASHGTTLYWMEKKPPNPVSLRWLELGGYKLPGYVYYPFTAMVTGFASLNVS